MINTTYEKDEVDKPISQTMTLHMKSGGIVILTFRCPEGHNLLDISEWESEDDEIFATHLCLMLQDYEKVKYFHEKPKGPLLCNYH